MPPRAILFVEDDVLLAMIAADLTKGCGLVVQATESFAGALKLLRCCPDAEVVTNVDLSLGPDGVTVGTAILAADLPHLRCLIEVINHVENCDQQALGLSSARIGRLRRGRTLPGRRQRPRAVADKVR